ncbi:MAG: Fe2+-dependent dioxygenase [Rhodospirillaceae bacterium]
MLQLAQFFSPKQLAEIRQKLAGAHFQDGQVSSGKKTKKNLQLDQNDAAADFCATLLTRRLLEVDLFTNYALPSAIRAPLVSLYVSGMSYPDHVDSPIMGKALNQQTRSDLSVTVFLSDIDSYDGGELILRTATGNRSVKLDAGGLVAYPTSYIHHVTPVTRGERLAMVTWVQSKVQDHEQRQILYDFLVNLAALPADIDPQVRLRMQHIYGRLLQSWARF